MIRLRNVHFGYGRGERMLDDLSLEIGAGLTLLVGPNGSGKSTLLKVLAGMSGRMAALRRSTASICGRTKSPPAARWSTSPSIPT